MTTLRKINFWQIVCLIVLVASSLSSMALVRVFSGLQTALLISGFLAVLSFYLLESWKISRSDLPWYHRWILGLTAPLSAPLLWFVLIAVLDFKTKFSPSGYLISDALSYLIQSSASSLMVILNSSVLLFPIVFLVSLVFLIKFRSSNNFQNLVIVPRYLILVFSVMFILFEFVHAMFIFVPAFGIA